MEDSEILVDLDEPKSSMAKGAECIRVSSADELQELRTELAVWYNVAEQAISRKDEAMLKSARKRIEHYVSSLTDILKQRINDLLTDQDRDTGEHQLDSVRKCKDEFDVRVGEWLVKQAKKDLTKTIEDKGCVHLSSSSSLKWETLSTQSSRLSEVSTTSSVRRVEAKIKKEMAMLKKRQLDEQLKLEAEKNKLEAEKNKLEAEKNKLEAEKRKLEALHQVQEADLEVQMWDQASNYRDEDVTRPYSPQQSPVKSDFDAEVTKTKEVPVRVKSLPRRYRLSSPVRFAPTPAYEGPSNAQSPERSSMKCHPDQSLVTGFIAAVREAMHTPKVEYTTFSGDPMKYWTFQLNFDANIEKKAPTDSLKLDFLLQQCRGQARELIDHCAILGPKKGYQKARDILYNNYGKPSIVARAFVCELISGPNLMPDDTSGIRNYAILMRKCLTILSEINDFTDLNSVDRMIAIASKLPCDSRKLWKRRAAEIARRHGKVANFVDLVEFVEEEAEVANTEFGKIDSREWGSKPQENKPLRRGTAYAVTSSTAQSLKPPITKCPCCFLAHPLSACDIFLAKSVQERVDFLLSERCCFNCFADGHIARLCGLKSQCTVQHCRRYHHTLLHINPNFIEQQGKICTEQSNDAAAKSTSEVTDKSTSDAHCHTMSKNAREGYLCVVPVKVRANNKEIKSYAFLDQGSDTTFCHVKLIDRLGLSGKRTEILMNTLGTRPKKQVGITVSLVVLSANGDEEIEIDKAMSIDDIPVCSNSFPTRRELEELPHLHGLNIPTFDSGEVTLLIGTDVPYAHRVLETRTGGRKQPFAARTPLGWSLIGPSIYTSSTKSIHVNSIQSNLHLEMQIQKSWTTDFEDKKGDLTYPTSSEKVVKLLKHLVEHKEDYLPLPRRRGVTVPEESREITESRLINLAERLSRNEEVKEKYVGKMQQYIDSAFAKEVPLKEQDTSDTVWYLPHYPVYHPRKPNKVRIVFDCAAKYKGVSLNDASMQGPDLVNSLVGVITTQFRKEPIAVVSDVEAKFHHIRVKEEDCHALRFLWWPGGDLYKRPVDRQMLVHVFGATSSPCCASFCLRQTADQFGEQFDNNVSEVVKNSFYVDDCLTSIPTEEEAIRLVEQLRLLLQKGGFRLTKWISNNQRVLKEIPENERAASVKDIDLDNPVKERVLGVYWVVFKDQFGFKKDNGGIEEKLTRRSILSAINSLYDPLGFVAPVVLVAKILQQEIVRQNLGWDREISEDCAEEWRNWFKQLPELHRLAVPRCFKPNDIGVIVKSQIHHFSDASINGYGAVSYLRLVDDNGKVHCSFLCGKARVTLPKTESIPRLELVAAVLSVKADKWLKGQLKMSACESIFWTDSCAVRQSINNQRKRFKTFVANRLAKIHRQTEPSQWRHVGTKCNPADEASRGISVSKLLKSSQWLSGPKFLWQSEATWPTPPEKEERVPKEFLPAERKRIAVNVLARPDPINRLVQRHSSLNGLKVAIAWLLRYKCFLRSRNTTIKGQLTVEELAVAELEAVRYVQRQAFAPIVDILNDGEKSREREVRRKMKKLAYAKCMDKLNPQLMDGVLRVGGRLENAPISYEAKHPIILPPDDHFTKLLIVHHHEKVAHSGLAHTWSSLRQRYWIIKGGVAVRTQLGKCIFCRKRNAPRGQQLMAELPPARLKMHEPPFSYVGVDYFGPFLIKRGRSEVKRYGCLFTCLSMRAVHIEVATDLSTDAFINAYRRFVGRRGKPVEIYSDNGTNFVGAERELRESLNALKEEPKLNSFFRQQAIKWTFNPPTASHMGGVWERMIRSIRKILNTMMWKSQVVSDDVFHTLMVEVENIVNSRPLTPISSDPMNEEPLTPNHLLLQRPALYGTPGLFQAKDCFNRRRWRQVQFLADEFWRRWSREYLPTIALRQKWPDKQENFEAGDVVLIVNDMIPRRRWEMGKVIGTYPDKHGVVRQVEVKTKTSAMKRPIAKLCLICKAIEG